MMKDIIENRKLSDKVKDIIATGNTGSLPVQPVLFLHKDGCARYYLIALNFSLNEVLVLDREFRHTEHGEIVSWDRWQGEKLWKSCAEAFGWPRNSNMPYVREIDWVEVCGLDGIFLSFFYI
jgi:hypothetical protein